MLCGIIKYIILIDHQEGKRMAILNYEPNKLVIGKGSLDAVKDVPGERIMIVAGGSSMRRSGVIDRIVSLLGDREVFFHEGVGKNPTIYEVNSGVEDFKKYTPDTVIAVGGGSTLDAAKAMILFYEHPDLDIKTVTPEILPEKREKIFLVAIPSTSGTASEVTRTSVVTDPDRGLKIPLNCMANKPDIAILDPDLTMTLPDNVVAETGMDALTHAVECYLRPDCDDFNLALTQYAILGIMKWLPISFTEKTEEARERMHNFQSMAGMAFTNVGLTMVHGISHAFGGYYDYPHGLTNGVILPYVLEYNKAVPSVAEKMEGLAKLLGVDDFIQAIRDIRSYLGIPNTIRDMGLDEETYLKDLPVVAKNSLMGPTKFNPIVMTEDTIKVVIDAAYYGKSLL